MKKGKIIYYVISIGWIFALLFGIWTLHQQSLQSIPNGHTVFMMLFDAVMAAVFFIKARRTE